jgi:glutamyl-tRNA reductase
VPSLTGDSLAAFRACVWETASLDRAALERTRREPAGHSGEVALLATCQRIEVYSFDDCACSPGATLRGEAALQHLAEVAAGLHSVVLGEREILGQARASFAAAPARLRWPAGIAVASARELRRQMPPDMHAGYLLDQGLSLEDIAPRGRLLVLGTGQVGRLVALRGRELGFDDVLVAGRTEPRGDWFSAGRFRFVQLERLGQAGAVDVAVGCLGSTADELDIRALPEVRRLIVDLGTPRNFAGQGGSPLVTIAELRQAMEARAGLDAERQALRERLARILERRLAMAAADEASLPDRLRAAIQWLTEREAERLQRTDPALPQERIQLITRSLVKQLFGEAKRRSQAPAAAHAQVLSAREPVEQR